MRNLSMFLSVCSGASASRCIRMPMNCDAGRNALSQGVWCESPCWYAPSCWRASFCAPSKRGGWMVKMSFVPGCRRSPRSSAMILRSSKTSKSSGARAPLSGALRMLRSALRLIMSWGRLERAFAIPCALRRGAQPYPAAIRRALAQLRCARAFRNPWCRPFASVFQRKGGAQNDRASRILSMRFRADKTLRLGTYLADGAWLHRIHRSSCCRGHRARASSTPADPPRWAVRRLRGGKRARTQVNGLGRHSGVPFVEGEAIEHLLVVIDHLKIVPVELADPLVVLGGDDGGRDVE